MFSAMTNLQPTVAEVEPIKRPIVGTIRPPGSKSLTNRALMVAALASGESTLSGVLDSQDTRVMLDCLQRLGIVCETNLPDHQVRIQGCAGRIPATAADLWLENSGTSMRFLAAACTLGTGRYRLDGSRRMRERPIGELLHGLRGLGANVATEFGNDCPPVIVDANRLAGETCSVDGTASSQFLSGLLMAAPAALAPVVIQRQGTIVSEPYINMTLAVMAAFGVQVSRSGDREFVVTPQIYRGRQYDIEPDASAASYFFAAAAISGGTVTVAGLGSNSLQGDLQFVRVLEQMGCEVHQTATETTVIGRALHGVDVDMNGISDTAQTLAAVAPFARGITRIRNVAHIRHKETDRIAAVATELKRLGQLVEEFPDGLQIQPAPIRPTVVQTYDDHRMAMSFALVGLRVPGIQIADPGCTGKTYPNFFADLQRLVAATSANKSFS